MAVFENENTKEATRLGNKLKSLIPPPKGNLSIYDASAQSGLSLNETKLGLMNLVSEFRGHLSATATGELLFSFPHGFTKPWVKLEKAEIAWAKLKSTALGVAKFVVRAWITVVMVAYVAVFAVILLAMMFGKNSDRDDGPSFGGAMLFHTLFRLILDSLFWTFHPFSPFAVQHKQIDDYSYGRSFRREPKKPFYEKVNGFFFGPEEAPEDPLAHKRALLSEIRAQNGYIGLFDVIRITGLCREKAEALLTKLMLDYNGDVQVSSEGGITYQFKEMLKSTEEKRTERPPSVWQKPLKLLSFTGNDSGSNLLIAGLNGFNFLMSTVAIANSWTLEKLHYIYTYSTSNMPEMLMPPPPTGTALILGWVPFWFSLALFTIPISRALNRTKEKARINRENGRRGIIKAILTKLRPGGVKEKILETEWKSVAKVEPTKRELTREVAQLGGEVEIQESGTVLYRFPELESEAAALNKERKAPSTSEIGEVVFSSSEA